MIKFTAPLEQGHLFGFGLSEANLNRMEFNSEPIFFDFGYMGYPQLFGLVLYVGEFEEPEDIVKNLDVIGVYSIPFLDQKRNVTPENLRVFPIAQSIMHKFRTTPFWGFETSVEVTSPKDVQIFFSGRTEQDIEAYFQKAGFIAPQTRRTYKGFGRNK